MIAVALRRKTRRDGRRTTARSRRPTQRDRDRVKWLTLLHDVSRAIDEAPNWREALSLVMRRICEAENWQAGYVYIPAVEAPDQLVVAAGYCASDHLGPFHAASLRARYARGQSLPGRVFGDGRHVWANGRPTLLSLLPVRAEAAAESGLRSIVVLPVFVGHGILAVVELCSDRPHPENDELVALMRDLSAQVGRVIDRERIMAQVGEIIWGEQQDLIHTLHDALGQHLTGLGMLATTLNRRLQDGDPKDAEMAQQIASAAQAALEHVRQLSRGLFPADIDGAGFVESLRRLASTTTSLHHVSCTVECDTPVSIPDSRTATQLYRIAQEAVTNAIRHAEAEHIRIVLAAEAGTTTLSVIDDGVGIHHRVPNENGIGLRIMRHRAISLGAAFAAGPGATGGTMVTCTLSRGAETVKPWAWTQSGSSKTE
jgi:signal transduction histidine kinase